MMGATILGATAAADLKDYPKFFLDDGTFNGVIVATGAADSLAAVDVAANMWYSKPATVGAVQVSGDAKMIGESGDMLELYEKIGTVSEVLDNSDLQGLKSYSVTTDKGSTKVNQYLRFDPTNLTNADGESSMVQYDDNDDDEVADFLYWKDGDDIFEYELEFTEGFESDIVALKLDDLEDKKLTILGKEFIVVDTAVSAGQDTLEIDLMGGATRDALNLDEKKSYKIGQKDYEVSLVFVDADECKFVINGETTDLLSDGETDLLSDGTNIGVSEVLYQDYAGGKQQCEFFLGADELDLTDTAVEDDGFVADVEANSETIEDASVRIRATSSGNASMEITKISYRLRSDGKGGDDVWIPAGKGLRSFLDEPAGMMHSSWDVTYKGLAPVAEEEAMFKLAGDEQYNIKFTNKAGKAYNVPYVNTDGVFKFGDDEDNLWFYETNFTNGTSVLLKNASNVFTPAGFRIEEDDSFVLSDDDITAADDSTSSYVLTYDSIDTNDNRLTFTDLAGGTYEVTYAAAAATDMQGGAITQGAFQRGDLIVGGKTYKVILSEANTTNISVDLNQDGTIEGVVDTMNAGGPTNNNIVDAVGLVTQYGAVINLVPANTSLNGPANRLNASQFPINISMDSNQLDESPGDEFTGLQIQDSGTELDMVVQNVSSFNSSITMSDVEGKDQDRGMSKYGLLLTLTDDSGDTTSNSELTVKIPKSQRNPLVYVELAGSSTSTSGGELARVAIPVTATKLPEEVTDVAAQNVISVGGPCANSVTSAAMYSKQGKAVPADCTEGFTPGEAVVALYDVGDKVAMVVAGYSGDDTRRAGKVLAQTSKYSLSGKQVTVTGTNFADISVTKVA